MNYAERVVDYTAMKMMLNELCCGFGCAMNRTTIKAVCHISFIDFRTYAKMFDIASENL